ncbi:MAG TPA: protein-arginine deiminase family protein [Myxococcales bacterium]|nr:protein-arginine deiminase family protein [Myxococcales bacterium]
MNGRRKAGTAVETCPRKWKSLAVYVRRTDDKGLGAPVPLTLSGPGAARNIPAVLPLGLATFKTLAPGDYTITLGDLEKNPYVLPGAPPAFTFGAEDATVTVDVAVRPTVKIKVFREDNNAPVEKATVKVSLAADGSKAQQSSTDRAGMAYFKPFDPGRYQLEVLPKVLDGRVFCAPRAYSLPLGTGIEKSGQISIAAVALELHLDADRDGTIDAAPSSYKAWTWGAAGTGAVVLVRTTPAQPNGTVIGERCPLELRWTGTYLDGWTASLSADPAKLRVYDANGATAGNQEGATLVIGRADALSWHLADPADATILKSVMHRPAFANFNGTYASEVAFESAAKAALEEWTRAGQLAKNDVTVNDHLRALEEPMTRLCGAPLKLNDGTRAALADELSGTRNQWVVSLGDVEDPGWPEMRERLRPVIAAALANTPATSPNGKAAIAWATFPDKDELKKRCVVRTPRVLGRYDLTAAVPAGVSLAAGQPAKLWIEAAAFPSTGADADWEAALTLTFTSAAGVAQPVRTAVLRIAPWLMSSDMDPTETVYVKAVKPLNYAGLAQDVEADSIAATDMAREIRTFALAAGSTLRATMVATEAAKGFMRDVIKCGYQMAPHTFWRVVLTGLDSMGSLGAVADHLKATATVGLLPQAFGLNSTSQDNGGNYTLSPPTPAYPWGRILLGHRPGEKKQCNLYDFYRNQRFQKPLKVDTTWLAVGHTDEILSVLPHAGGHKVLIASGRLAYAIVCRAAMPAASADEVLTEAEAFNTQHLDADVTVVGMQAAFGTNTGAQAEVLVPMGAYAANPPAVAGEQMVVLLRNQDRSMTKKQISFSKYLAEKTAFIDRFLKEEQRRLDATRRQLTTDLGIAATDIIEIPVTWDIEMRGFIPETADSVNLLTLVNAQGHSRCLIPKPFGPVFGTGFLFEKYIGDKLGALGNVTFSFLNDWRDFHTDDGEIHCGTNQLPAPLPANRQKWWLRAPPPK